MRIIVVGGGKVGSALCRSLIEENHDVILIEEKETVMRQAIKRHDIVGIIGNGANFKVLEQADVATCDIFVALTEKDEVNMISAVLAKKMGAKETIVRVRNPEYSNPYFREKNFLGFSMVVNPEMLTARHIANTVDFPNSLSVEHFANGRVMLMEFKINQGNKLSHMALSQFRKKFSNLVVCAIERDQDIIIPKGDAIIEVGDRIFVTGQRSDMGRFHNFMRPTVVNNLLLIGAGKIAYYLLNILQHTKVKVKVIEIRQERAEWFSQEFPHLHIVNGDGTAKDILLEESAGSYDAVATLTGVDEENIITSMFLHQLGVQKNITKVNRTSLLKIIDKLGHESSSIITPKSIAVDAIMHFIRGRKNAQDSSLDALHHVANGRIETLQFEIKDPNKMANHRLSELHFKKDVLIVAIIRNGVALFPTGEDRLQVGDKIIVTTLIKNVHQISDLLKR